MAKLLEKFNRLRARTKFGITFLIIFILGLLGIPAVLSDHSERLPPWPKWEFAAVWIFITAGYAALLAGFGVLCEQLFERFIRPNLQILNRPTALKTVIVLLILALGASLGWLVYTRSQIGWWEMEVYGLAGFEGSERALHDFQNGKVRLFVIARERDHDEFSGTNNGPFQIWFPQYYTALYPMRYSIEREVEFYNRKMRYMHEHPDRFLTSTNQANPTSP
jgi:uncharacterized membrane protein